MGRLLLTQPQSNKQLLVKGKMVSQSQDYNCHHQEVVMTTANPNSSLSSSPRSSIAGLSLVALAIAYSLLLLFGSTLQKRTNKVTPIYPISPKVFPEKSPK
ncbi:hypothetical protein ACH5RR_014439 [Cinchona calisaya]|uniref:Uncharacterized protein n=1 Tax=Cinchona calisaya TaxID=153742 RepID=A0ABD3A6H3_9GENT